VEWYIEQGIKDPVDGIMEVLLNVWDPAEPDRFINLATTHKLLLTFEEEVLWKTICSWRIFWDEAAFTAKDFTKEHLKPYAYRKYWPEINKMAKGQLSDREITDIELEIENLELNSGIKEP